MIKGVADLPYIDEHQRAVAASTRATWEAVRGVVAQSMDSLPSAFARAWGLDPPHAQGPRPLEAGSTLPGFRVVEAAPGHHLVLEGRHRFSRYRLEFLVDDAAGGAVVRARSYATFPGLHGAAYRTVVIGSRGHVLAVRRMLATIVSRAEHG